MDHKILSGIYRQEGVRLSLSKPSRGKEAWSFAALSKSFEAERERLQSLERKERVCAG
jgi:hypothetical protein